MPNVHTTADMKQQIVCPLTLKIAIASGGRLGAIQSYRCHPKPNIGGWETRPQKDKWAEDFFRVLNAKKDEDVKLTDSKTTPEEDMEFLELEDQINNSDWEANASEDELTTVHERYEALRDKRGTVMKGIDQPSATRFLFTHQDGMIARKVAIKKVIEGKLRAPRNWDKSFAADAGISLDELKRKYSDLYQTQTRNHDDSELEIEQLGTGFFGEDETVVSEEDWVHDSEREEHAYSVVAELGLEDELGIKHEEGISEHNYGEIHTMIAPDVPSAATTMLHAGIKRIRADMGGEYVMFYKVMDPNTGKNVWLHEGINECLSNINLVVNKEK